MEGYRVFDAGRKFGSQYGQLRELSDTWARETLSGQIADGMFRLVRVENGIAFVCRPSDFDAAQFAK